MLTVTALDALGNVVTDYTGNVRFTNSDTNAAVSLPVDYEFVAADRGVHTFNGVTLATAGKQTITATDTGLAATTGTGQVTVNPAAASTLVVTAAANLVLKGVPAVFTVTAKDRFGNTATGYRGVVKTTSNDAAAGLPGNYTFTAADNGVHTFFGPSAITFNTLGLNRTITATDTAAAAITGTANVRVIAPAAAALRVTILSTIPTTDRDKLLGVKVGTAVPVIVAALDANGFLTPAYAGKVHFTSTDNAARAVPTDTLPADYTFVAGDLGTHTFNGVKLTPRGRRTVTATDTRNAAITGSDRCLVV
jgi:hypothetical protein